MVTIRDVVGVMNRWAPPAIAESWDNPGLVTGNMFDPVAAVLVTLDVTEDILDTARRIGATLVISHHPAVFRPLRSLSGNTRPVRVLREAVRGGTALFSAHTNLDQAPGGVSHALAERLGLRDTAPLVSGRAEQVKFVTYAPPEFTNRIRDAAASAGAGEIGEYRFCSFSVHGTGSFLPSAAASPSSGERETLSRAEEDRIEMVVPSALVSAVISSVRSVHPYDEMAYDIFPLANTDSRFGYGAIGMLEHPIEATAFIGMVAELLDLNFLTHSGVTAEKVQKVAVMGGSGAKYIGHAAASGADAYVTGEIGYHDFLEADEAFLLVDATHRATEMPVLEAIRNTLRQHFPDSLTVTIDPGTVRPQVSRHGSCNR